MNAKEKIEELLEASEDGTITAAQVTEAGLHRSVLQEFVKSGEMYLEPVCFPDLQIQLRLWYFAQRTMYHHS